MEELHFDPVGEWVTSNIHRTFEEYSVPHAEAIKICVMNDRDYTKMEYRISGSMDGISDVPSSYTLRFNPLTWAQSQTNTDSFGNQTVFIDTPKLTTDGWFEPGQSVIRSGLLGTPRMMVTWRDFLLRELLTNTRAQDEIVITTHDYRYFKITQAPTEDDTGWGLYVDLDVDCALYYCQYTLGQVMYMEIETSSVHVLFSGESSFNEYERDSAGELTLVGVPE